MSIFRPVLFCLFLGSALGSAATNMTASGAALTNKAPALAAQFRLLDPAFEIPGTDGIAVAVYALDGASRVVSPAAPRVGVGPPAEP